MQDYLQDRDNKVNIAQSQNLPFFAGFFSLVNLENEGTLTPSCILDINVELENIKIFVVVIVQQLYVQAWTLSYF